MLQKEHEIVGLVYRAKESPQAADDLIAQYLGFIRSQTAKFTHSAPENGHEDEMSLAMFAFYEAIVHYEKKKGPFLSYAARAIKNRLIDHYRVEKRRGSVLSLQTPLDEEGSIALQDTLVAQRDALSEQALQIASQQEITEFGRQLEALGLSFSEVADNCPRQQRTLRAMRRVLDFAKEEPALLGRIALSGRLPISELSEGSGVDKKTLERHRKYLLACLLAFTNGYDIIRGHLCQVGTVKGGTIR